MRKWKITAMSLPILWSSLLNKKHDRLIWIGLRKLEKYMANNNRERNQMKILVSFSGGKDSQACLIQAFKQYGGGI